MERGIHSASSSDEEADLQPHCLQGYGESNGSESDLPDISGGHVYSGHELHCLQGHGGSSGSESDMPDISVGDVCAGTAVDFV